MSPAAHHRETVRIDSPALGRAQEATVLVPASPAPPEGWPVLYLLHGGFSHHGEWADRTPLVQQCAPHPMLVVTPEAEASMYLNGDDGQRFADFTLRDVPALIEARYPVRRDPAGRAMAGLSMGGFGAMNLGLSQPERFVALGSLSGAFGMTWWNLGKRPPFRSALGPEGSHAREHFNPWRVMERFVATGAPAPRIGLWVGTGDDPDVVKANRDYHTSLASFGIAHGYREGPGGHDWDYWVRVTPELLAFIAEAFGVA